MKINCDLGEGRQDIDTLLLPLVDQASIACGAHAGNDESIRRCLTLAQQSQTEVGIHPSYPDRENFGRVSLAIPREELQKSLNTQIDRFLDQSKHVGLKPAYIKAHGALYNDLAKIPHFCDWFFSLVAEANHKRNIKLAIMVSASLQCDDILLRARALSLNLLFEAFADRSYQADGSLTPRHLPGAVLDDADKIIAQYLGLKEKSEVDCPPVGPLHLPVDTVCFHGDNPASVIAIQRLNQMHTRAVR